MIKIIYFLSYYLKVIIEKVDYLTLDLTFYLIIIYHDFLSPPGGVVMSSQITHT